MSITDESAALAPSEHAMRVELQAQVGRLESVIAVLKQQAANYQRNELESLEHVRTACRQRDEARAERDDANEKLAASQAEVARWSVLAGQREEALVEARALNTNLTATVIERAAERDAALAQFAAVLSWQPGLVRLDEVGFVSDGKEERVFAVTDLIDDRGLVVVSAGEIITVERFAAREQVKVCDESGGGSIGFVLRHQKVLRMPPARPTE